MKKSRLSKMAVLGMVLLLWANPLTVFASSKVLTEPLSVTQKELPEEKTVEETEELSFGPLTPDGNLTLVDDYGSAKGEGKQFITVETKNGQYFYIIIDRDDHGMETVHFLNKVEEEDLLAMMEEEAVQDYLESTREPEVTVSEGEEPKEEPTEDPAGEDEPEQPAVVGLPPVTSLLLIAGVMGVGGIGGYFYLKKNKKNSASTGAGEGDTEEDVEAELEGLEFDDEDLDEEDEED